MKYIREGRFGMAKQYKTGAVVNTYPKPLLVLSFDEGGLDVIQTPVVYIQPSEIEAYLKKSPEELPPIVAIDFCDTQKRTLTPIYQASGNSAGFQTFVDVTNKLCATSTIPFKTVVVDPITGLSDLILSHIAATQASAMADARKWAGNIGLKLAQTVGVMTQLNAHVVFIMHAAQQQNELTQEISILPLIHSRFKDRVGALLSQFFYATKENGKAVVYTTDKGYVKGIGARWPANLPAVCPADFTSIYGKEIQ